MKRISKDNYYLGVAKAIAARSTCLKRQYGCVIVNNDEIVSTGYNGSPRGMKNCCDRFTECPRRNIPSNGSNYDDCQSVHAEQNAIISAARREMLGGTMYLWGQEYDYNKKEWHTIKEIRPCQICKRLIANAGIASVVVPNTDNEDDIPITIRIKNL